MGPRTVTGWRRIRRSLVAATALVGVVVGIGATSASADTTVNYAGSTTGTQSTIVLSPGTTYQRQVNPNGTVDATINDTTGELLSTTAEFEPGYTPTQAGPFGLWLYVRTDLEQQGQAVGTATPSATEGILDLDVQFTTRLRITVYRVATETTPQNPATDQKLTLPERCWVDLSLSLTGTANRRTGDLHLEQNPFTIPPFPGDPGDVDNPGGTADHRCQTATDTLNAEVAGATHTMDLNFTGGPTTAHVEGSLADTSNVELVPHPQLHQTTFATTGTLAADFDFEAGTITNVEADLAPVRSVSTPETGGVNTGEAEVELVDASGTLTPSSTAGIDDVSLTGTLRLRLTVWEGPDDTGDEAADGSTCFVEIPFDASGTLDRGTNRLSGEQLFTLPAFPSGSSLAEGCWNLGPGLTQRLSGPGNLLRLDLIGA